MATDLDQRLLPDELTLPVIPVALVYALSGQNPFVGHALVLAVVAAVVIPLVLYLPSIPFGAGAFGMGDVKLLVGVGLMSGGEPPLGGGRVRRWSSPGVVLLILLATRRIGRRTYVPFGPFLIVGALWAVLIRPLNRCGPASLVRYRGPTLGTNVRLGCEGGRLDSAGYDARKPVSSCRSVPDRTAMNRRACRQTPSTAEPATTTELARTMTSPT